MVEIMKHIITSILFLFAFKSLAGPSDLASSLLLRQLVEIDSPSYIVPDTSIVLPVSPGLDQGKTALCWAFATLSLLESNLMLRYPQFKNVSFSRAFIQRNNAEERAIRSYILNDDVFSERGTMSTALELISKYGLMPLDGTKYISDYGPTIENSLDRLTSTEEKLNQVKNIIDRVFFKAPPQVSFNGKNYTPQELAALALNNQKWLSYGFKSGAKGQWGPHPDPDAFKGTQSWYVDPSQKASIIYNSLKQGYPLTMLFGGHIIVIYGADYDSSGKPLKYYLKDSSTNGSSPTYAAEPDYLDRIILDLETIDLRSKI